MRTGLPLHPPRPRPAALGALPALCALAVSACSCAGDRPSRAQPEAAGPAAAPAAAPASPQLPLPPPPAPPPAPPPKEKAVVPKGCDINLAGRYKLAVKPYWSYLVEDDGEHLLARRADLPDAGEEAAGKQPALSLDRTARGFVGFELGYATSPSGNRCPVTFRAELTACAPQGLTLRTEDSVALDDQCHLQRPAAAAASEKVLVRQ